MVRQLLSKTAVPWARIAGIGVGVIAFVDPDAGRILSAPSFGWGEVDVAAPLAERLGLPVVLEHHARAMALAEQWFGHARQTENFALVRFDSSIGIGLVIDGRLLRGDSWRAGQVAHMVVDDNGPMCACGRRGCLVTRGSYRAIAARAREHSALHPDSPLASRLAAEWNRSAEEIVFELAGEGDHFALSLIEDAAQHVARAIIDVVALLDPRLIVLSADGADRQAQLLVPIQGFLAAHAPPHGADAPRTVESALGQDLPVLGGATLAFERLITEPEWYADTGVPHVAPDRTGAGVAIGGIDG